MAERRAAASPAQPGPPLAEVHPSWWGYFWYWAFFFLVIPPVVAWLKRGATVLRVHADRITIERGILSKCYQDYHPRDIRSIDVDQTFLQRLLGIGDLMISTSATVEASERLASIPDPQAVRELILAQRGRA
ncbi:MAG: PH domain-containing protein [Verrucomicrobiota bacterium]